MSFLTCLKISCGLFLFVKPSLNTSGDRCNDFYSLRKKINQSSVNQSDIWCREENPIEDLIEDSIKNTRKRQTNKKIENDNQRNKKALLMQTDKIENPDANRLRMCDIKNVNVTMMNPGLEDETCILENTAPLNNLNDVIEIEKDAERTNHHHQTSLSIEGTEINENKHYDVEDSKRKEFTRKRPNTLIFHTGHASYIEEETVTDKIYGKKKSFERPLEKSDDSHFTKKPLLVSIQGSIATRQSMFVDTIQRDRIIPYSAFLGSNQPSHPEGSPNEPFLYNKDEQMIIHEKSIGFSTKRHDSFACDATSSQHVESDSLETPTPCSQKSYDDLTTQVCFSNTETNDDRILSIRDPTNSKQEQRTEEYGLYILIYNLPDFLGASKTIVTMPLYLNKIPQFNESINTIRSDRISRHGYDLLIHFGVDLHDMDPYNSNNIRKSRCSFTFSAEKIFKSFFKRDFFVYHARQGIHVKFDKIHTQNNTMRFLILQPLNCEDLKTVLKNSKLVEYDSPKCLLEIIPESSTDIAPKVYEQPIIHTQKEREHEKEYTRTNFKENQAHSSIMHQPNQYPERDELDSNIAHPELHSQLNLAHNQNSAQSTKSKEEGTINFLHISNNFSHQMSTENQYEESPVIDVNYTQISSHTSLYSDKDMSQRKIDDYSNEIETSDHYFYQCVDSETNSSLNNKVGPKMNPQESSIDTLNSMILNPDATPTCDHRNTMDEIVISSSQTITSSEIGSNNPLHLHSLKFPDQKDNDQYPNTDGFELPGNGCKLPHHTPKTYIRDMENISTGSYIHMSNDHDYYKIKPCSTSDEIKITENFQTVQCCDYSGNPSRTVSGNSHFKEDIETPMALDYTRKSLEELAVEKSKFVPIPSALDYTRKNLEELAAEKSKIVPILSALDYTKNTMDKIEK